MSDHILSVKPPETASTSAGVQTVFCFFQTSTASLGGSLTPGGGVLQVPFGCCAVSQMLD